MYFLYSVLTAAGMILLSPYLAVQGLRRGKYFHSLRQRMGYLPASVSARAAGGAGVIWIHAVSVGEAFAAVPLARGLKERFPEHRLVVSTTTATGQRAARERLDFADTVFYFPLDWAGPVRRAFRAVNPSLVIVLETEIWPQFLREARRRGVPVAFVNARISERSFRGYRLAHHLAPGFLMRVLSDGEAFLAQSEDDARRLRELGATEDSVKVTGNLKYDSEPPALGRLGQWLAAQAGVQDRWPIVIAGSVVADEEEPVLAAYDAVQRQWRRSLLVLAPRKPERFDAAARIVAERGWKVVRRSSLDWNQPLAEDADAFLLDSIGELAGLYSLADAVFVGGSLVPAGGHNILEPAWFSRPPMFGPSMDNFRDAAAQFLAADAAVQVESSEALGRAWVELIRDESRRAAMGRAARALVERNRGATARTLDHLHDILKSRRQRA